jgi:hypothetical protein
MEDGLYERVKESEGTTTDTLDLTLQVAKLFRSTSLFEPCFIVDEFVSIVDGNAYYKWLMAER